MVLLSLRPVYSMARTTLTCLTLSLPFHCVADSASTGETPWVHKMVTNYHEAARKNNAIVREPL